MDTIMTNLDGQSRHRNGQSICCGAARSIISSLNSLYENDAVSILNSTHAALVAAYALAIHIIRSPTSGLARADFEVKQVRLFLRTGMLMRCKIHSKATEIIQTHREWIGQGNDADTLSLNSLLKTLREQVAGCVEEGRHSRASNIASGTVPRPINTPNQGRARTSIGASNSGEGSASGYMADQAMPLLNPELHPGEWLSHDAGLDIFADGLEELDLDWDMLALTYGLP